MHVEAALSRFLIMLVNLQSIRAVVSRITSLKPNIANISGFRGSQQIFNNVESDKLLARIAEINQIVDKNNFIPFMIGQHVLGQVQRQYVQKFVKFNDVFKVTTFPGRGEVLCLTDEVSKLSLHDKTQKIHRVSCALRDEGFISGWRDEFVSASFARSSAPVFLIERAAYSLFGLKGYGIHVNGYVRDSTGRISHMWVATRARDKSTFPGMLDHIVAGGQPYGISLSENVIKECAEEADIPEDLALSAAAASVVSYEGVDSKGNLKRDVLICYDLELPSWFTPKPIDGEVEKFELKRVEWVLEKVQQGGPSGYKPNCNLVIIDFFIRHGFLSADTPGFLDLVKGVRSGDCS